jgi:hypothetical protein
MPDLHGKLKIRFTVGESGSVTTVEDDGSGSVKNAALVTCIGDALKSTHFPKPPGTATVLMPLVLRK